MLILQSILTALLSGLFSGAVMFSLNERRDRAEAGLRRLEELYEAFDSWCTAIEAYHRHTWQAAYDTFEFHRFEDEASELKRTVDLASSKATFLLDVWAPDLRGPLLPILTLERAMMIGRNDALQKRLQTGGLNAADLTYMTTPLLDLYRERLKGLNQIAEKARGFAARPMLFQFRRLRSLIAKLPWR